MSPRFGLKLYCIVLGGLLSFLAFFSIVFELYVLSQTSSDQTDLLMARYLDLCFGLLAFSSSLALMYGAFVESKTWIAVWTLSSATALVGCWVWFFYRKYFNEHPESLLETQSLGTMLTLVYVALSSPVWFYYHRYLSTRSAFFVKPWCISSAQSPQHYGNNRSLFAFPPTLCTLRNFSAFFQQNSSAPSPGQYIVADMKVQVPKEEDLYNPV